MRAKQERRRQTRASRAQEWREDWERERQEALDELAAIDEMMLGYDDWASDMEDDPYEYY